MSNNFLYDVDCFKKEKENQKTKQRKRKRKNIILAAIALLVVLYLILPISKISSVNVIGNSRISDEEVKKQANIDVGYFSFLKPSFVIDKSLYVTNMYSNVEVEKSLFGNVVIKVSETEILFYEIKDKKEIFYDEKGNELELDLNMANKYFAVRGQLISKLDKKIIGKLIDNLVKLDESVLSEISQIKYTPKKYDDEYFQFIMSGDRKIYLNTSLDYISKVGLNYHNFAINTRYKCTIIEYLDAENKAVVKKCS